MTPISHLYLHVPFCPTICPYCDFHVVRRQAGWVEAYLKRLLEEAGQLAGLWPLELETIYLGGGTPSFLRDRELAALVEGLRAAVGWAGEVTLEVNPGTVSRARAELWRELGFTRASLGIQSLDDQVLRFLGRTHSSRAAREAASYLRQAGLRLSADLITAVPSQRLEREVASYLELDLEHLSAYSLTVEEGTEFARRGVEVAEEDEREAFYRTEELLAEGGLLRYEISNYARPGAESRHNLGYWTNAFYAALGPSAAGHYPSERPGELAQRRTAATLEGWLRGEGGEVLPVSPAQYASDAAFMGLRLERGIDLRALGGRTGLDLLGSWPQLLRRPLEGGLLELQGGQLRATRDGWWVLNQLVTPLVEWSAG